MDETASWHYFSLHSYAKMPQMQRKIFPEAVSGKEGHRAKKKQGTLKINFSSVYPSSKKHTKRWAVPLFQGDSMDPNCEIHNIQHPELWNSLYPALSIHMTSHMDFPWLSSVILWNLTWFPVFSSRLHFFFYCMRTTIVSHLLEINLISKLLKIWFVCKFTFFPIKKRENSVHIDATISFSLFQVVISL